MISNRLVRVLAAPVLAISLAGVVSALLLVASGNSPGDILQVVTDEGFTVRSLIATLNRGAPYYLAGVAVAIGFKMNLFNIGVEGQYRLAALVAAAVGAAVTLPAPLHLAVILLTAMLVGMAWASIAGVLRATRGVSEVISTIMLNAIALGLTPYLLERFFRSAEEERHRLRQGHRDHPAVRPVPEPQLRDRQDRHRRSPGLQPAVVHLRGRGGRRPLLRARLAHPLRLRPAGIGREPVRRRRPAASTPAG